MKVFSKEGSLLCEEEVLPFNCVHGIHSGNVEVFYEFFFFHINQVNDILFQR